MATPWRQERLFSSVHVDQVQLHDPPTYLQPFRYGPNRIGPSRNGGAFRTEAHRSTLSPGEPPTPERRPVSKRTGSGLRRHETGLADVEARSCAHAWRSWTPILKTRNGAFYGCTCFEAVSEVTFWSHQAQSQQGLKNVPTATDSNTTKGKTVIGVAFVPTRQRTRGPSTIDSRTA